MTKAIFRHLVFISLSTMGLWLTTLTANSEPIRTTAFISTYRDNSDGILSSQIRRFLRAKDIVFAKNTGDGWSSFGFDDFGTLITNSFDVAVAEPHTLTVNFDGGNLVFIKNALLVADDDEQGPQTRESSHFSAVRDHSFRVKFFLKDFEELRSVNLFLPDETIFTEAVSAIPETSTLLLLGTGFILVSRCFLRKKKAIVQ